MKALHRRFLGILNSQNLLFPNYLDWMSIQLSQTIEKQLLHRKLIIRVYQAFIHIHIKNCNIRMTSSITFYQNQIYLHEI